MRTYTIGVRVDFDNQSVEKEDTMREAVRMAAKHLLATAMLISDKRKPTIALHSSDFFEGNKEISLADDIE